MLVVDSEISKQNQNLLTRMLKIETEPMRSTINIIPKTIPSNKETFLELKERERRAETNSILKENMVNIVTSQKIIDKLESTNSQYNTRVLSVKWKDNKKYKEILAKKGNSSCDVESVPDYMQLLKEYEKLQRSRISRPRTAFPSNTQPEDEYI